MSFEKKFFFFFLREIANSFLFYHSQRTNYVRTQRKIHE